MVIIKCNQILKDTQFAKAWESLYRMKELGVILLPPGFELLNEVPADAEVVVVKDKEAAKQ
jgi:hypothetical protein